MKSPSTKNNRKHVLVGGSIVAAGILSFSTWTILNSNESSNAPVSPVSAKTETPLRPTTTAATEASALPASQIASQTAPSSPAATPAVDTPTTVASASSASAERPPLRRLTPEQVSSPLYFLPTHAPQGVEPQPLSPTEAAVKTRELLAGEHHPYRIMLRYNDAATQAAVGAIHDSFGFKIVEYYEGLAPAPTLTVEFKENHSSEEVIQALFETGLIEQLSPDYTMELTSVGDVEYVTPSWEPYIPDNASVAAIQPSDPRYGEQWSHAAAWSDVAWSLRTSADDVIIAIDDTGARLSHEDLKENLWINEAEANGAAGVDDDNNGYVDDIYGYNGALMNGDVLDTYGHGSHVSGIVAARGDNGKGVSGVAWNAKLLVNKIIGTNDSIYTSSTIRTLTYAAEQGARVINASFGSTSKNSFYGELIRTVGEDYGLIFVAAAGNNNKDNDAVPFYPASFDAPNIISVGATNKNGEKAWFSNYGLNNVDIFAPGDAILSTGHRNDTDYFLMSGTSMATPYVTGLVGLLIAQYPDETAEEIIERLFTTRKANAALVGKCVSEGEANAFYALSAKFEVEPQDIFSYDPASGLVTAQYTSGTAVTATGQLNGRRQNGILHAQADFNGDGFADLLWENTETGSLEVWFTDGLDVFGVTELAAATELAPFTDIVATDFDFDGDVDLIFNDNGRFNIWYFDGLNKESEYRLAIGASGYDLVGFVDIDGDGDKDQILQFPAFGLTIHILLDGVRFQAYRFDNTFGVREPIQRIQDFNGDGSLDYLVKNPSTGAHSIILMTSGRQILQKLNFDSPLDDYYTAQN